MTLLPADIILIKRGTLWMPFAPAIWLWQKIADPTTPWSWAYHVEMVWDLILDPFPTTSSTVGHNIIGYKAFSLQPPVLQIVERKLSDLHITAYRLKDRSQFDISDMLGKWGNMKIGHQPYILGWSTCGHPIVEFYRLPCDPYPGSIEAYCRKSEKFIRIM